jgi:hypothetical protein
MQKKCNQKIIIENISINLKKKEKELCRRQYRRRS